ncbi:hypothetical protein HW450_10370 [Corynebacterium hindlerae]|uniref:Uncharacterized protein n=1 Tax=Corynebacterium hindlerae TaxID=699041 RepID=A0A7G5FDP7_9CORY|nr:hypothetical protein [Corynebacterium hindlerae]QMV84738.1 hypothetical protein HW450_10370 [Corynebacterium hindlerae]
MIDSSLFTHLAVCPHCQWREFARTKETAWYELARHLKAAHGDMHAARNATKAAEKIAARRRFSMDGGTGPHN